jgi:hypothetical protein
VIYPCERCNGRGWDAPKRSDAFPDACAWCKGAGRLRTFRLAKILHVWPSDLYRVEHGRAGVVAGTRVLAAIERWMPGVLGVLGIAQRVANL